jgi:hypothetical protein
MSDFGKYEFVTFDISATPFVKWTVCTSLTAKPSSNSVYGAMKLSNIRYNAPENKIYLMTCQTGMYLSSGVNYGLLVNMIHE